MAKRKQDDGPELLKQALIEKGWSMGHLEQVMDLADGIVCRWVNRRRNPGLKFAIQMEDLLGVPARSWITPEELVLKKAG